MPRAFDVLALVSLTLASSRAVAAEPRRWHEESFAAMATRIALLVPPEADSKAALAAVSAVFTEAERDLSEWREGSPLATVNEAAGQHPVAVPPDLLDLVERSVAFGTLTDGAFDLTWAALWPLWRFRGDDLRPPSPEAIAAAARLIDYRRVVVDHERRTVFLPTVGMKIGLGGVGKGYALDRAAKRLRALGLTDFLLSAGGQILAAGTRDGAPWRVGLRDPRGSETDLFAALAVGPCSVSTSGDYERFFIQDGVRYHHIIDPRTGWPSRGLRSATAIAPDGTLADALSTAFMVLGTERSLALAARLRASGTAVDVVLVDDRGAIHTSPGLESRLQLRHAPAGAKVTP